MAEQKNKLTQSAASQDVEQDQLLDFYEDDLVAEDQAPVFEEDQFRAEPGKSK